MHCSLEFAGSMLTLSDASSETFNFAALRWLWRWRCGLTSIDGTQYPHPVDGVWWSLARLQGLLPERGPPPIVARRGRLACVGDGRRHHHGQVPFCGELAGVGMAYDFSGDMVVALR